LPNICAISPNICAISPNFCAILSPFRVVDHLDYEEELAARPKAVMKWVNEWQRRHLHSNKKLLREPTRVARWFIFKPKVSIWENLRRPSLC
jgi:hypothetical protein